MYLGHVIFMFGRALSTGSKLAWAILLANLPWFRGRVLYDERRLRASSEPCTTPIAGAYGAGCSPPLVSWPMIRRCQSFASSPPACVSMIGWPTKATTEPMKVSKSSTCGTSSTPPTNTGACLTKSARKTSRSSTARRSSATPAPGAAWVDAGMDAKALAAYFRVLAGAEGELQHEPPAVSAPVEVQCPIELPRSRLGFSAASTRASISCTSAFQWTSTWS